MAANTEQMDQTHFRIKQEIFNETWPEASNSETVVCVKEEVFDDFIAEENLALVQNEVITVKEEDSYVIEFHVKAETDVRMVENTDSVIDSTKLSDNNSALSTTKPKPYPCTACGKCFPAKSSLVQHIRIQTGDNPFECKHCGREFYQKCQIKNHNCVVQLGEKSYVKKSEENLRSFQCQYCGKCFPANSVLIRHIRVHTGEKPFGCKDCDKTFSQKSQLKKHRCGIYAIEKSCSTKKTDKKSKLTPKIRLPTQCENCGKSFRCNADLVRHIRMHTGEKPFKCEDCGRQFSHKWLTKEHRCVIHDGKNSKPSSNKPRPHQCKDCGKCFSKLGRLVDHTRIHTGEKPFKCLYCEKCFTTKGNLLVHTRVHTKDKPYKCEDCGKEFSQKGNLMNHIAVHKKDKSYVCKDCGKCFSSKGNLVVHMRVHTRDKPYKCEDCGKEFSQKCNLKHHRAVHTGERHYECEICGNSFQRKIGLKAHKCIYSELDFHNSP